MGIFDRLFGNNKNRSQSSNAPSPGPEPVHELSTYEKIESAISQNPLSASFRAEYTETAHFKLLELPEFLFRDDPYSYVCFDLETTGLNSTDDTIIEIGAVRVHDGVITDRYHQLVNPNRSIPACVSAVNHITDDMVSSSPLIYEVLPDFLSFVGSDVLVAHNARFDSAFIAQACLRYRFKYPKCYFDSRELSFFWPDLPNRKLSTFLEAAGIENPESHRALADAESLARLMVLSLNQEFNLPLPDGFDPGYSVDHFTGAVNIVDSKLSKKRFVLTGKIEGFERSDFERLIASHGGKCTLKISNATDFLVVGSFPGLPRTYVSRAVINARKMISEGGKIQLISPDDVLLMMEEK